MKHHITAIVSDYLLKVEKSGIPVQEAYVFGSQVIGTATKRSDIDLCIVSTKFGFQPFDERVMLLNLRDSGSYTIEPHPFSPDDLQDTSNPLSNEIRKHGVRV